MDTLAKILTMNFKTVMTVCVFAVGFYVQFQINTQRIIALEEKCDELDRKLDAQYQKIDAIKLDKSVFDSTVKQITEMSIDIREIRSDLKEVLKR